jgi:hypothetical protein
MEPYESDEPLGLTLSQLSDADATVAKGKELISKIADAWFKKRFRESDRNVEYAKNSTEKMIDALSFLLQHPERSYDSEGKTYLSKIGVYLGIEGRMNQNPRTIWHWFLIVLDKAMKFAKRGESSTMASIGRNGGSYVPPHIKPSHEGRFTAYEKRNGLTKSEAIARAKRSGNTRLKKEAIFAQNAARWNHHRGGRQSHHHHHHHHDQLSSVQASENDEFYVGPKNEGDEDEDEDDFEIENENEYANELIAANLMYYEENVKKTQTELIEKCKHFLKLVLSLHAMLIQKGFGRNFSGRKHKNVIAFENVAQLVDVLLHYEQIILNWMEIKQALYANVFLNVLKETDIAEIGSVLINEHPELDLFYTSRSVTNVLFLDFLDRYACSKIYVDVKQSKHFKIWQLEDTELYLKRWKQPSTREEIEERKKMFDPEKYEPWDTLKDHLLSHFHHSIEFSPRLCWRRPFPILRGEYLPDDVEEDEGDDVRNVQNFFCYAYANGTYLNETRQTESKRNWLNPLRGLYKLTEDRNVSTDLVQCRTCLPITEIRNYQDEVAWRKDVLDLEEDLIYYATSHVNVLDNCDWTMNDVERFNRTMEEEDETKERHRTAIKRKRFGPSPITIKSLMCNEDVTTYSSTYHDLESKEYTFLTYIDYLINVDYKHRAYQKEFAKRKKRESLLFDRTQRAVRRELEAVNPLKYRDGGRNLYGNFHSFFPTEAIGEPEAPKNDLQRELDLKYYYKFTGLYSVILNHLSFRCEIECLTPENRPVDNEAILSECCDDHDQWLEIEDPALQANSVWFKAGLRGFLMMKGLRQLKELLEYWQLNYDENARYEESQSMQAKIGLNSIAKAASDLVFAFSCPKEEITHPIPVFRVDIVGDENTLDVEFEERKRARTAASSSPSGGFGSGRNDTSSTTTTTTTSTTSPGTTSFSGGSGVPGTGSSRQFSAKHIRNTIV